MKIRTNLILFLLTGFTLSVQAQKATILGWNNLGMHCMDSDYSVFSILPPYNTIEAQLIVDGKLLTTNKGFIVTYQAVADPQGSFNSSSVGKGNFYNYALALYGMSHQPDQGLLDWAMPGISNVAQPMLFETTNQPVPGVFTKVNWFRAEGIPITPYDNAGRKNPYPLMRLIAWNNLNEPIATNDIVLPVSDEMDCRACHASGSQPAAAEPSAGWVWDGWPERDYRLNILRLHDEHQFQRHPEAYAAALKANQFNQQGLYRTVTADGRPVLCAVCHASEALGIHNFTNIPPLTASVHSFHAHVQDPELNTTLDDSLNRSACYRCHPGSTTRCLRGAMGGAVAPDGTMQMQCQSCHGSMSQVGSSQRIGWLMEPGCQSCHNGTATANKGQIRYTTVFADTNGSVRTAADAAFATQANTPAPGLSMYRFSAGHGGLQCEACHGSTHAEFPSTHSNDNLRNIALQGHAGVMAECVACHTNSPVTITGGPHGMHPVGSVWVSAHPDLLESGQATRSQCQGCHGTDYRGTVLSRMQADRTMASKGYFKGAIIGCYACHNGPNDDSTNTSPPPVVSSVSTNTTNDRAVVMELPSSSANAMLRIVSQPANGSVGLKGNTATYFPNPGFAGTDRFTFAAYDFAKNSNLATGTVAVARATTTITAMAHVPPSAPARWPAAFACVPFVVNTTNSPSLDWDFGDGTSVAHGEYPTHAYGIPGTYTWSVISSADGASVTNSGTIEITAPIVLSLTNQAQQLLLSWPYSTSDTLLEFSPSLPPTAQWVCVTNLPEISSGVIKVALPLGDAGYFRLRRPW